MAKQFSLMTSSSAKKTLLKWVRIARVYSVIIMNVYAASLRRPEPLAVCTSWHSACDAAAAV